MFSYRISEFNKNKSYATIFHLAGKTRFSMPVAHKYRITKFIIIIIISYYDGCKNK